MSDGRICFYCDALISEGQCQKDHFPIPANAGGTVTVDSCITCHDMKDRFKFGLWSNEWVDAVISDFPKLRRETRIMLAKFLRQHAEISAAIRSETEK